MSQGLLDVLIRAGLIAVLATYCYQIFYPFLNLMIWALILAITLYPLHGMLKERMGKSDARAATLLTVISIAMLLIPIYLLGTSVTDSIHGAIATVKSGSLHIPPPPDAVADWPLIGKRLHTFWQQAATDMTGVVQTLVPHLKGFTLGFLGKLAGIGVDFLLFIGSLIIAGIIMAFGDTGHRSAQRIARRIVSSERGDKLVTLCTATIRAVAQGVIGIAFIQMLLVGVAFVVMDIPGAGLLALGVLLLGIMQVPATLITIPVIGFVFFSEGASLTTIAFAVYTLIAGLADNVLKPMMLGRGVDVPMPVVLIGALGGMVASGIIGLFIGPVLLALGYKLFWQWVDSQPTSQEGVATDAE